MRDQREGEAEQQCCSSYISANVEVEEGAGAVVTHDSTYYYYDLYGVCERTNFHLCKDKPKGLLEVSALCVFASQLHQPPRASGELS